MNEDLLATIMTDIDPVRGLSESALDELVPNDRLMARVLEGVGQPWTEVIRARPSIWHRRLMRVGAVAAAAVLVASGAVAFRESSPSVVSNTSALGVVHSSWVEYSAHPSGATYSSATRRTAASLVSNGRVSAVLHLDGLTIAPPTTLTKPRASATEMARELWATTALEGEAQVAFGYGDITVNVTSAGVPKLHDVPVWVAIATPNPCSATSTCNASAIASLPLTVVVSGYGLPNSQATTGIPIAFTYQTKGLNSSSQPRFFPAIEQVSVRWANNGHATSGKLHITTAPVPCGVLNGYSLTTDASGTTLTVKGLIPESTIGDYCAASPAISKVIALHGDTIDVKAFRHAPLGPMPTAH